MSSTIDAFENGAGPQWKWLRIGESLTVDDERGLLLERRSKRGWTVGFVKELGLTYEVDAAAKKVRESLLDHGRPMLQIYKHKPKNQPQGPFLLTGHEREKVIDTGKISFGQLKPAVLAAMKLLVLMDVVPRLTGER